MSWNMLVVLLGVACIAFVTMGCEPVDEMPPIDSNDNNEEEDNDHADLDDVIYVFDISHLHDLDLGNSAQVREAWDTAHLAASVQGIVNRDAPLLFVRFLPEYDDFWLEHLRQEGEWLEGHSIESIESIPDLLTTFADRLKGYVTHHENLWATSNLASTIAGVEDRVCLRYDENPDSVYQQVMGMDLELGDEFRLFNDDGGPLFPGVQGEPIPDTDPEIMSTGSPKADAYIWAKQRYLDTEKVSDEFMAFYLDTFWLDHPTRGALDNNTVTNHDFFISQRAFFFDLSVHEDEAPGDCPDQPLGTDREVLIDLLDTIYTQRGGGITHIGGFTPWLWKYTSHAPGGSQHDGVPAEWDLVGLASTYNAIIDADAIGLSGLANASFYQHHPMDDRYEQNPRPTVEDLQAEGLITEEGHVAPYVYFTFYMGDYDSAAWLNRMVPQLWDDPARFEAPMSWAFNPNLDRRAPHALHYVRTNQGPNDWFISGDSGAGYVNPGMLWAENRGPGHPDGWDCWVEYCSNYFEKFDLSITGFVIDGFSPGMGDEGLDRYMEFSPEGLIGQKIPPQAVHRGTMPVVRMQLDLHGENERQAADILEGMVGMGGPRFLPIRTILKTPSWHKDVMDRVYASDVGERVRFVDPFRFMLLLKTYELDREAGYAAPGPYSGRDSITFVAPNHRDGVAPISVNDGPFEHRTIEDREVLYQAASLNGRFLYFDTGAGFVPDTRTAEEAPDLRVRVSLHDRTAGRIGLQYDSHRQAEEDFSYDGGPSQWDAYRETSAVTLEGSGEWIEVTFELPEVRFANSQNHGANFRLVNMDTELIVDQVTVEYPG